MPTSPATVYFAHTKPGHGVEEWEPLDDHLSNVSRLAGAFAAEFGASDWARLAGLWHDLGKYRRSFQDYLRAVGAVAEDGGCEETAPGRVDHSTVGALHAMAALGPMGKVIAYLIAGHHAGLADSAGDGSSLTSRLDRRDVLSDWPRDLIPAAVLDQPIPLTKPPSTDSREAHLWLRLLFSCVTDADYLATEAFMSPERATARAEHYPEIDVLTAQLDSHISTTFPAPQTDLARLRSEVLQSCVDAAAGPPGLFTLTVPTGGGKTLSSMAFALHHARKWKRRRVIYAIPYTSIVEQIAEVFREIFGAAVVEHHSNLDSDDPARDSLRRRLSTENWDARIIVTTNVQLFESLFAARTSRCRKLHNIVNSVIVLDEPQLLPPEFIEPIRQSIRALTRDYGVSIVLSTATQPALEFSEARELAPNPAALDLRLRRVRYEWPRSTTPRSWESIASDMAVLPQVLCIVNRRDDARQLYELLRHEEGAVHLSALMCGDHRAGVIASVKARLRAGEAVRLVSTQLVEAGVDLDFPTVYRAFAGLDSIAQAAGRCNREARLSDPGRVVVFNPPRPSPPGLLRKAELKAREVADQNVEHIDPALFAKYFVLLYKQAVNSLDEHGILRLLGVDASRFDFQFRTAADLFRLVKESGYSSVVVDWGRGAELIAELRQFGAERLRMRRLQRFVVNIPQRQLWHLRNKGAIDEVLPGLYSVTGKGVYDANVGLRTEGPEYDPGDLIC